MGNLADDTAVTGADGAYTATFGSDWEIWGPNGGYVAAVALRAAGAHTTQRRPASLLCHYLGVGRFDDVQITTTTLRAAKRAESVRVSIEQDGAPIAEALVWCVADDLEGLRHEAFPRPDVALPESLTPIEKLLPEDAPPPNFTFWKNFEERPLNWIAGQDWQTRPAGDPVFESWYRYRPQPTFDDLFVDACRLTILVDTLQWPAATRAYRRDELTYMAPSLDLAVSFHHLEPTAEWLLVRASSPAAADGLVGGHAAVWSPEGRILATGGQQMLCRPARW